MRTPEQLAEILEAKKYIARNETVLIRIVIKESERGVMLPQNAEEGSEYIVVGMGPKVEQLKIGDKVRMYGQKGIDWDYMPNTGKAMLSIPQKNIPYIEGNIIEENGGTAIVASGTDDVPEFDPNQFPDADISSVGPEKLAAAREINDAPINPDEGVLKFNINGDPMSIIVVPGESEEVLYGKITNLCRDKYGLGKLVHLKGDNYHWRTR
jgi:hypothetical protein